MHVLYCTGIQYAHSNHFLFTSVSPPACQIVSHKMMVIYNLLNVYNLLNDNNNDQCRRIYRRLSGIPCELHELY